MPELGTETRLRVNGASPYDVVVGHGVLGEVARMLGDRPERVATAHSSAVPPVLKQKCQQASSQKKSGANC